MSDEKTKYCLITAAKKLFCKKGFDGVSVKEIATEAGANISAISYHFSGKEGLYYSCLEDFGNARLAMAERILTTPASLEEFKFKLQLFAEEIVGCHLEQPDVCHILHRDGETNNPAIHKIFRQTFMKVFQKLVEFTSSAQKKKLINPKLDPFLASSIFFGSLIQFCRSDDIRERFFDKTLKNQAFRESAIQHMIQIFIYGAEFREENQL